MSSAGDPARQRLQCVACAVNRAGARVRYRAAPGAPERLGRIVGYRASAYDEPCLVVEFDEASASWGWCPNHLDPTQEVLTAPLLHPGDWSRTLYSGPGRLLLVSFDSDQLELLGEDGEGGPDLG